MSRVLITGGAGFIGRWLAVRAARAGCGVVIIDDFSVGRREHLQGVDGITLVEGDIRDQTLVTAVLQEHQIELVYHLAAIHYIPYCEQNPIEAFSINVGGTLSVIEAMRAAHVQRLVFASTGALYPSIEEPLTEDKPVQAHDIYGLTKLHAEQIIHYYHQRHAIRATIARLFNTYGPYETNPHLLPHVIQTLKSGETTIRLGNLHPKRDYVYVEGVAEALYRLAQVDEAYEIYNIGTGVEYSVAEVIQLLSKVLNRPLEVVQDPERVRPVDKMHQRACPEKLRNRLGWFPQTPLHEGLTRWLAWEGITASVSSTSEDRYTPSTDTV